ncbi:hypothetical protein BS78_10G171400 [Paspalum vaginatum]|nr:hypothetical protein BS78_10G171400 [Paspalum vaginatum]
MAGEKQQQQPEAELVLLDFWVSPFGQRCRIALAEKRLAHEYLEQELLGTKSDLLLRSNPVHKKVPVLLHSGRPVCKSLVIIAYLDEAFPDASPSCSPPTPTRARARFWAAYSDKDYEAGTWLWKLKGDARAQARYEIVRVLGSLDAELGDKEFFDGDVFGLVDIALVPFAPTWARRCAERESVAKTLYPPEKVDEFITLLKKVYGIE